MAHSYRLVADYLRSKETMGLLDNLVFTPSWNAYDKYTMPAGVEMHFNTPRITFDDILLPEIKRLAESIGWWCKRRAIISCDGVPRGSAEWVEVTITLVKVLAKRKEVK